MYDRRTFAFCRCNFACIETHSNDPNNNSNNTNQKIYVHIERWHLTMGKKEGKETKTKTTKHLTEKKKRKPLAISCVCVCVYYNKNVVSGSLLRLYSFGICVSCAVAMFMDDNECEKYSCAKHQHEKNIHSNNNNNNNRN